MKKITISLALLTLSFGAKAQQVVSATENLDELVIEESRMQLPFQKSTRNIQVLTKEEIQRLPVSSLNELLAYVNGVDIRQRGPFGSQADISIDGGSFEQTMVLWNGVKMGDAQTGHHAMNLPIPFEAIERIEVLKGPAARIYGINALTGAINVITKTDQEPFVQVHAYGGSSFKKKEDGDGSGIYSGGGIQATTAFATGKVKHLAAIGNESYNGQRYNTASENTKLLYQGNTSFNAANSLEWMGGYIQNEFGANSYYAAPVDKESYEFVETMLLSIGSKHRLSDRFVLKPRISNRYNRDDYRFYRHDISKARSLHYSNAFMFELNGVYTSDFGDISLGYEARLEAIHSSNIGFHERTNHGGFIEYKQSFFEKLSINVGAYLNYNTDYGFQWYPGADVAYLITSDWKAMFNIGSSQRIPSFTDLYINQRPGNIGNPDLKPESAWQFELGANYDKESDVSHKRFYVSAFQRDISNFIDYIRTETNVPYQPHNLGSQIMRGFSFRWNQDFKIHTAHRFGYQVSYQYLSPKSQVNDGTVMSKYVMESLKHQAIFGLNYTYKQVGVQWQNRLVKRELSKSYFVSDLRLMYDFERFQVYAQGTNLFDATYKEVGAVPMPSRWLQLGVTYRLKLKKASI